MNPNVSTVMQNTNTIQHSTEDQAQYIRAGKDLTINFRTCHPSP